MFIWYLMVWPHRWSVRVRNRFRASPINGTRLMSQITGFSRQGRIYGQQDVQTLLGGTNANGKIHISSFQWSCLAFNSSKMVQFALHGLSPDCTNAMYGGGAAMIVNQGLTL